MIGFYEILTYHTGIYNKGEKRTMMMNGKDGKKFWIKKAEDCDVEQIMEVMESVKRVTKPEWFVADDRDYIKDHIEKSGFILKAETKEKKIAGFFMVDFPRESSANMGIDLGLKGEALNQVVHMDSAAVLPEFRGNHLQEEMMKKAEEILDETGKYRYRMCTVCPENQYSLHNVQKMGYRILKTAEKYGGLLRHILYKDMAEIVTEDAQISLQSER